MDGTTENVNIAWDELIAFVSRIVTLNPGDIITTGMPHGIGDEVFLKAGDVVEGEIEGLGVLRNPVVRRRELAATAGSGATTRRGPARPAPRRLTEGPGRAVDGWSVAPTWHLAFWDRSWWRWEEAALGRRPVDVGEPLFDLINEALAEWRCWTSRDAGPGWTRGLDASRGAPGCGRRGDAGGGSWMVDRSIHRTRNSTRSTRRSARLGTWASRRRRRTRASADPARQHDAWSTSPTDTSATPSHRAPSVSPSTTTPSSVATSGSVSIRVVTGPGDSAQAHAQDHVRDGHRGHAQVERQRQARRLGQPVERLGQQDRQQEQAAQGEGGRGQLERVRAPVVLVLGGHRPGRAS